MGGTDRLAGRAGRPAEPAPLRRSYDASRGCRLWGRLVCRALL